MNYHLENLRDLLSKGEDENYRISEFGYADLSVIDRVETPWDKLVPVRVLNLNKLQGLVVILLLVISTLLSGYFYLDTRNRDQQLEAKVDEFQTTSDILADLSELFDELFTAAREGRIILVKSYDLKCYRTDEDRFGYEGSTSALFYSPFENSSVKISLTIDYPCDLEVPLVIQRGILVPIDGSDSSLRALKHAFELAKIHKSEITSFL